MFFEVRRLYDKRLSFPSSDRVPEECGLGGRQMLATVEVNNALGVHPVHIQHHTIRLYLNCRCDGVEHQRWRSDWNAVFSVSYTHLRAHETPEHLVCRL